MTGMKYIRFKNVNQLDQKKIDELFNTIFASISSTKSMKNEHHSHSNPSSTSFRLLTNPIIEEKSSDDNLEQWFNHNRISKEVRLLFDFQSLEELIDYGQLLIEDPQKQIEIYSRIYSQKCQGHDLPPHQFNRFSIALQKLFREKRPLSASTSTKSNQSNICIIS